jgi:ABC-2 type transport system ATP-binding protein
VLLATHQTEDVAALCDRVIVIAGEGARFDGLSNNSSRTGGG